MSTPAWQLQTPIDAVVFDCDGTLSTIEGVDELAKNNGVCDQVSALTAKAMGVTGLNPTIYQERLNLIGPRREQVLALGQHYFKQQVPDAVNVINVLQRLGKTVYIVSAGLHPAICIFAALLQIPVTNIFAVDVQFDLQGNFIDYDHASPLVHNHGKRNIVQALLNAHPTIAHIGDGLNDFVTHDIVTRFIGFGGVFYREQLATRCKYYINANSLAPLLALVLTQAEYEQLPTAEKAVYEKGLLSL